MTSSKTNGPPLCTCADRGEPDWNGHHDADCPYLVWKSGPPSIAELQRREREIGGVPGVPLAELLEIAAAALAWRGEPGDRRTDSQMRALCERLVNALAKVRP